MAKQVIVEMSDDLAAWLQLNAALGPVRVIGEFLPTATPNKVAKVAKVAKAQEFPKGTRLRCQHRPPEDAPTRRAAWDHLKDRFGDMVIVSRDARESLVAAGIKGGSSLVTVMLRQRELKPVTE